MVTLLDTLLQSFQQLLTGLQKSLSNALFPAASLAGALGAALTLALHVLVAVLAVLIVWRCAASLLRGRTEEEHWGFFSLPNGAKLPLNHWENIIGRAASCDIVLSLPTVSRQHAAVQRDEDGLWTIYPLGGKGGVAVNGKKVNYQRAITVGDKVTVGGVDLYFFPASAEELRQQTQRRQRPGRRFRPTTTLAYLTAFQGLLLLELVYAKGAEFTSVLIGCFGVLCAAMWGLYALYRLFRRTGFELESLAFFLTSLCLCVTASSSISTLPKQTASVLLGLLAFVLLGLFLRDLAIAKKLRWPVAIAACALLAFNVLFGQQLFGARNWVSIGPLSFQPSEFVKVAFILAGAETMDRLFARRNLIFTILFSLFCVGCLALMSDFGTALIFFIAFLAIAFLRSGDLPSIAMICAAAAAGCGVVLKFKPYIANRFAAWRHVWEFADTTGYQQTRTMSAAASGGLFGNGADNGWLKYVGASNTDLVFGMVAEELGLIVAVLTVVCIVTFSLFTIKAAATSRSTFYTIAACSTSTMLVFQTVLNVLGSVDLLPLTGVTFPFLSCGGSSMMACWALLAFIKAGDNRQNSGLAVRLPGRKDEPVRPGGGGDPMLEFDPSVFDDTPVSPARRSPSAIDIPLSEPRRHSHVDDVMADLGSIDFAHLDTIGEDCGIDVPLPGEECGRKRRSSIDIPVGDTRRSSIDIPIDNRKGAKR